MIESGLKMDTPLKKRRVFFCPDSQWEIIEYLQDKTELHQSEILRKILNHLQNQDWGKLLEVVRENEK